MIYILQLYSGSKDKDLSKYSFLVTSKVSLSKDCIERIMQCMVIKYYLEEESIGNTSGFSADYIKVTCTFII